MSFITATGHICFDTASGLIHGTGATADEAQANARFVLARAGIRIVQAEPEYAYGEQPLFPNPPAVVEGDLETMPATAALIEAPTDNFDVVGGIACYGFEADPD